MLFMEDVGEDFHLGDFTVFPAEKQAADFVGVPFLGGGYKFFPSGFAESQHFLKKLLQP
jgi:hypothetical protein